MAMKPARMAMMMVSMMMLPVRRVGDGPAYRSTQSSLRRDRRSDHPDIASEQRRRSEGFL